MNRKVVKIISVLLIAIMVITTTTSVFAATMEEVTEGMKQKAQTVDSGKITSPAGSIMGVLQVAGMVISVIVLIVIGIKYLMGSVEQKAEYKKSFVPYIVGAILVFAASAIAGIVVNFSQNIQ